MEVDQASLSNESNSYSNAKQLTNQAESPKVFATPNTSRIKNQINRKAIVALTSPSDIEITKAVKHSKYDERIELELESASFSGSNSRSSASSDEKTSSLESGSTNSKKKQVSSLNSETSRRSTRFGIINHNKETRLDEKAAANKLNILKEDENTLDGFDTCNNDKSISNNNNIKSKKPTFSISISSSSSTSSVSSKSECKNSIRSSIKIKKITKEENESNEERKNNNTDSLHDKEKFILNKVNSIEFDLDEQLTGNDETPVAAAATLTEVTFALENPTDSLDIDNEQSQSSITDEPKKKRRRRGSVNSFALNRQVIVY
jgi:hypothetical protein